MAVKTDLKAELKNYFGFDNFKGNQEAIIENLMAGNDTFCAYAYRRRQVAMLSIAVLADGRHCNCHIAINRLDEESGRR